MNVVIDIGNTVAKVALFQGEELVCVEQDRNDSLERLDDFVSGVNLEKCIVASVVDVTQEVLQRILNLNIPVVWLDYLTPLPIKIAYETPHTLGVDRIAAVVAANFISPGRNILVIDAGTCITYEFIDASGVYHGGNISPGLHMRLKALHQYTAHLPLVEYAGRLLDLGKDTETAIRSGVMQGIKYEMEGYITSMKYKYPELLIFLTGGDEFSFDTSIKNIIFADRFLVLRGLNRILNYNNGRI